MKIDKIETKIIKNSREEDTIKVEILCEERISASASVPQGKSTGEKEALVLPAIKAVEAINAINNNLKKKEFKTQEEFDKFLIDLDGTENKSRLGANTILALSLAFARVIAKSQNKPLYQYIADITNLEVGLPNFYMNLINGGAHANNNLDWQEYMVVVRAKTAEKELDVGKEIFNKLAVEFKKAGKNINYGDEGGYNIDFESYEEPLKLLHEIIGELKYQDKVNLALDVAADSFSQQNGAYYVIRGSRTSPNELTDIYKDIVSKYPIISIEDPFDEHQIKDYATLNQFLETGNNFVVGDDLTATNPKLIKIALNSIGGVIIKPNQIGTLTETLEAVKMVKEARLKIIVSHRSGETMDDFIADLAYGVGAFGLKAGAPGPKERMVKYERIIEIEKK
jgi:enolase